VIDSREVLNPHENPGGENFPPLPSGRLKLYDGDIPIFEHFKVEKQLATAFRRKCG
jgi:Ribonuclease G/E